MGIELCRGGSLWDLIKRMWNKNQEFSDEDASKIVKSILKSLVEVHRLEIVHWDVKPANFLFKDKRDFSSIKICDFGLAKKISMNVNNIQTGSAGTLLY